MNGYIANNAPLGINTTNAVIGNGMKGSSNMSLGIGGGGIPQSNGSVNTGYSHTYKSYSQANSIFGNSTFGNQEP